MNAITLFGLNDLKNGLQGCSIEKDQVEIHQQAYNGGGFHPSIR
jgi:hypothetical protein